MSSKVDGWYYDTVDTANPLSDLEKQSNVDAFYNYFLGYMTLEAMAGILGNMQRESYLNPGQGQLGHGMSTSSGLGLIQWTPGSVITTWASDRGLNWFSGQTQCYRIKCEGERIEGAQGTWLPTSDYPYSWTEFCGLTDYEEACKAYLFERERAGVSALSKRLEYASNWNTYLQDKYGPGPGPGPEPPTPHEPIDKTLLIILASRQGGKL